MTKSATTLVFDGIDVQDDGGMPVEDLENVMNTLEDQNTTGVCVCFVFFYVLYFSVLFCVRFDDQVCVLLPVTVLMTDWVLLPVTDFVWLAACG